MERSLEQYGMERSAKDNQQLQDQITSYWNNRSHGYDEHPNHGFRHSREKGAWLALLQSLLPDPPMDVLDVGTGTGFLALLLAELGHRVVAIDLADAMLEVARSKLTHADSPRFEIGDATDPDFPSASFDVITNRHLLWTLVNPESTFTKWHRLLRPGGRLVAIDSINPSPRLPNPPSPYSEELLKALPLRHTGSTAPVLEMLRSVCFVDAKAEPLEELHRLRLELDPEHEPPLLYAFIANR
jgi:ubiquinone/menaquinone biosynthesis C-methylase UbiE